jgi:beta-barrel assembly-enhancing protease
MVQYHTSHSWKNIAMFLLLTVSLSACKGKKINLFSIEDDKALGAQVEAEIASNPNQYPILDSVMYKEAYQHLRTITRNILDGGKVETGQRFEYKTYIIHDDNTLNAFCTPGGYIYVYTGLIRFLESEYQLAGVMGHEIAHADRRHSTLAMSRQFGVQLLLDIVFGRDKGALARIAAGLGQLSYGREAEREADRFSVIYLYPTSYDARGAARFFEKLESGEKGGSIPEFLSTHPNPGNRIQDIIKKWETMGSKEGEKYKERYQQFINSLPPIKKS